MFLGKGITDKIIDRIIGQNTYDNPVIRVVISIGITGYRIVFRMLVIVRIDIIVIRDIFGSITGIIGILLRFKIINFYLSSVGYIINIML